MNSIAKILAEAKLARFPWTYPTGKELAEKHAEILYVLEKERRFTHREAAAWLCRRGIKVSFSQAKTAVLKYRKENGLK